MMPVSSVWTKGLLARRELTVIRAVLLMAGLLARRFCNRLLSGLKKKKGDLRSGTGRKRKMGVVFMAFVAVSMAWSTMVVTGQVLNTLGSAIGPVYDAEGRMEMDRRVYRELAQVKGVGKDRDRAVKQALGRGWTHLDTAQRETWERTVWAQYRDRGIDGFSPVAPNERAFIPKLKQWEIPESRWVLCKALGALLLLLAVTRYFATLGSGNQDLGQVDWSAEWFFTLPLPARHFFTAQILGHALVDPFSWIVALPFLTVLFISAGLGWWAPAAALLGTVYLAVVMASLQVLTETWLRKKLASSRLKNLQAVFTVLGMSSFFVLLIGCRPGPMLPWLVETVKGSAGWMGMTPFALPILFLGDTSEVSAVIGHTMAAALVLSGAVAGCIWLVRDGLVTVSGAYAGRRGARSSPGWFIPAGIIGKDVRLLLRDRNFFVQALVVPLILVGFQLFYNGGLANAIGLNFQYAAAFAYGLGAYALTSTALGVLAVEGNALWMLYGFPVPLHRIMLKKTVLWAGFALAYTVIALVVCSFMAREIEPADLIYAGMACVGVVIHAFIASGLGMLGTDPLETEVKRRLRVGTVNLYMVLAAMFGYAIYAPSWWTQAAQLVLSCLLAYALWQKVSDHAPYLLDPVAQPRPQVSLADGLIAALAFFVLQGLVSLIAVLVFKVTPGPALTIAFGVAGGIVAFFALFAFWRRRVPHLAEELGLALPWEYGSRWRGLAVGLAAGLAAGCGALLYLFVLANVPMLSGWRDEAVAVHKLETKWLVMLMLVAAPLCEEFIFRGIVFRGMRRSLSVGVSVLASAGVFAICHPPISVVPVFLMAVLAAWSFERTKWLATPIIVHAVYNGMVLLGNTMMG